MSDAATDATSDMVLMTVALGGKKVSLRAAADALGISVDDFDAAFGLVPIDLDRGLYAAKVRQDAVSGGGDQKEYRGPYSNPKIGAFGPPKSRK